MKFKADFIKLVLTAFICFLVGWVLKPSKVVNNVDYSPLNQRLDSLEILIKEEDQKIDSIHYELNIIYHAIDTTNKDDLRNMLNDFPIRSNH